MSDISIFHYNTVCFKTIKGDVYYIWREESISGMDCKVARITDIIGFPDSALLALPHFQSLLIKNNDIAFADFSCSNGKLNSALMFGGMREVITLPDFDLPRLFSPLANDSRKRLNYSYSVADEIDHDF